MRQPISILMLAPCLLALIPSVLLAQGPPPDTGRRAELIRRHDTDGDGKLSAAEIEAARPKAGQKVAPQRSAAASSARPAPTDRAGELKNDAKMQALLEKFDIDGDGKLDLSEMAALRAAVPNHQDAGTQGAGIPGSAPGDEAVSRNQGNHDLQRNAGREQAPPMNASVVTSRNETAFTNSAAPGESGTPVKTD